MPLEGLAGRGVLVTGAGSSVGRVIAERFMAADSRVYIADINPEFVASTLKEVPGLSGSVCDLGDRKHLVALFVDAPERLKQIDFLVNCVGIPGPHASLEDIDPDDWRKTFEVNAQGIFETMRRVIPGMKARRFGAVVNFSSASTRTAMQYRAPYVASKAAVEALTRVAARELGPHNVRCNAILPGAINNARYQEIIERSAKARGISVGAMDAECLRFVSMRTKIEPAELADMVLYLCSDSGCHITGQLIEVSGNIEWEE